MKRAFSRKKSRILAFIIFTFGILTIKFFKLSWWPEIALLLGITNAFKKYLRNEKTDMIISLVISLGIFCTVKIPIDWNLLLPALFILHGAYFLLKDLADEDKYYENEFEEDVNEEIKEDR